MRFISTLCFLLLSSIVFSQAPLIPCRVGEKDNNDTASASVSNGFIGKTQDLNVQTVGQGDGRIILRCGHSRGYGNGTPLLIVDGEVWPSKRLSTLTPNDIKDVEVLKSSVATALYGCKGMNGALIITLKRPTNTMMFVKDNFDNSPLSKATITFVFPVRNDTLRYVADDSGRIVTNSARELVGCRMIISAEGFRTETRTWSEEMITRDQEIFLSRDMHIVHTDLSKLLERRMGCGIISNHSQRNLKATEFHLLPDHLTVSGAASFSAYPNPVKRGGEIVLQISLESVDNLTISVTSASGNNVHKETTKDKKGYNSIRLRTGYHWTPGVYFVKLFYGDGRVAGFEKIIIQQ